MSCGHRAPDASGPCPYCAAIEQAMPGLTKKPPNRIWKMGERVIISNGGELGNVEGGPSGRCMVVGTVALASANGVSLILAFEGPLWAGDAGAYVAMMPVLWTGEYFQDLITHTRVDLSEAD